MRKFNRYKENLRRVGNDIWSYSTHVATIDSPGKLIQHGWWSVTTQKHVNYVANKYDLPIIEMDEGKYAAGHLNIIK